MAISGTNLAGTSTIRNRVGADYYATPFSSTQAILDREFLIGSILEPACGEGYISKVVRDRYPYYELISTDLVKREDKFNLGLESGINFLTHDYGRSFDNVITNPPFALVQEFIYRALEIANDKVLMFCKIQLLEGKARKKFLEQSPLKKVYVFSERQNPLRNGEELDENGKRWSSTMCFAWFVWEQGFDGKPIIEWI
jgi:hypothetical protein